MTRSHYIVTIAVKSRGDAWLISSGISSLLHNVTFDLFIPEIIGGMLDLEPRLWRNPRREAFEAQKSKVLAFGAKWKEFDFTRKNKQPARRGDSDSSSSSASSGSESDD